METSSQFCLAAIDEKLKILYSTNAVLFPLPTTFVHQLDGLPCNASGFHDETT